MLRKKLQGEAKPTTETSEVISESKPDQDAPDATAGEKRPGEDAANSSGGGGKIRVGGGAIGGQAVHRPGADSKRIKPAEIRIQKGANINNPISTYYQLYVFIIFRNL